MGTVSSLEQHRLTRRPRPVGVRAAPPRATLFFDLSSPYTYLAAERADRLFARLEWLPAADDALQAAGLTEEGMHAVCQRAMLLGLPFVWPEEPPHTVRGAMRVAALAADRGRAAPFVLAASRLAFCGGFELDHPEVLAEAAAAADLGLEECLCAAGDPGRDGRMEEAARRLMAQGARRLPAVRVGRVLFDGEDRLREALAASQAPAARAV